MEKSTQVTPTSPSKPHPFTQPLRSPSADSANQLYSELPLLSPSGRGSLSFSSLHSHTITSGNGFIINKIVGLGPKISIKVL